MSSQDPGPLSSLNTTRPSTTAAALRSLPPRSKPAGCGNMGASHARAYAKMPEFEIAGVVSRGPTSREKLSRELGGVPEFGDYYQALAADEA